HYTSQSEHAPAIAAARRILASDPLREHVHRKLIALYLANDEPGVALKQYRACAQALHSELRVEPARETQALLPRVMAALPRGGAGALNSPALTDLQGMAIQLRDAAAACERARSTLLAAAEALLGGAIPAEAGTAQQSTAQDKPVIRG